MITWGQVANWKRNISSSVKSMITKPGRLVSYEKWNPPTLQNFFRGQVIVLVLWENARIIFGNWLPKNCANFSWVGESVCVFRFSTLAILLSTFLFSVAKKVANIPLFSLFQISGRFIICSRTYMFLGIWQIEIFFNIKEVSHSSITLGKYHKTKETILNEILKSISREN